jgi:hypothetical protein
LKFLITLGDHVKGFYAGDDDTFYIVLPDDITPEIRRILGSAIALRITPEQAERLEGNTPMNLRHAIKNGNLKHPGWKYQHLWDAVCKKAGIVELSYAQQVANVGLTVGLYVLLGAVKVGKAVGSLRK